MPDLPLTVGKMLLVYGPLGILAALGLWFGWKKDREVKECKEAHEKERTAWQERYITKAEQWAAEYQELAKSMNAVLDSLSKRR